MFRARRKFEVGECGAINVSAAAEAEVFLHHPERCLRR
jgi:hypothetical protein